MTWLKNRPGRRQNIWLFISVADEKLNMGQPRTTAASVQNQT